MWNKNSFSPSSRKTGNGIYQNQWEVFIFPFPHTHFENPQKEGAWRVACPDLSRCLTVSVLFRVTTPTFLLLSPSFLQFSSVAQSSPTLCDPMNHSTPGLPVHHKLPEFTQTHAHRVSDSIQPSLPLSSPSPPLGPQNDKEIWLHAKYTTIRTSTGAPIPRGSPRLPHKGSIRLCGKDEWVRFQKQKT